MDYLFDEENKSYYSYCVKNFDEETENFIPFDDNQKDKNINFIINLNKNKEKFKNYKKNQNKIFQENKFFQNESEITATKNSSLFKVTRSDNSSTTKNKNFSNEINELSMLNKKRKETNDKGHRPDIMVNKHKVNFFINLQATISKIMINSEFCKNKKLRLYPIKKDIYNISKSSENLDLLKLKIKDVLSKYEKHNEEVINLIINEKVYPLFDIFNKNVKDLMDIYCGKVITYESYYIDLTNRYKEFINKIKIEKTTEYYEEFINYVNNFENYYNEKNKHPRKKRNNFLK